MPLQPMITGARHMISAGHYLATEAGHAVLEAGGNAVDAGVAAGIALGVVHSDQVQFSGVAPMIIYLAERDEAVVISGLGGWPRAARLETFLGEHGGVIPLGILRTVVPAAPDAWILALERYGTMSFGDVAGAAIRYAREGFTMHPVMAHYIAKNAETYRRWPDNAAIYLPAGPAAARGRAVRPGGSRPLAAVHGGRGARGEPRRTRSPGFARRATRSIAATSRRRWCATTPSTAAGSPRDDLDDYRSEIERPLLDAASAASRCSPAARGARGRSCSRCCRCSPPTISPRSATTRRPTSISSPRHEALLRRPRALLRRSALRRTCRWTRCSRRPTPPSAGASMRPETRVGRDAAGRRRPGIRPAGRPARADRRRPPRSPRRARRCPATRPTSASSTGTATPCPRRRATSRGRAR